MQAIAIRKGRGVDLEAAWLAWCSGRPSTTMRARFGDLRELGRWLAARSFRPELEDPKLAAMGVISLGAGRSRAILSAWRTEQADRGLADSTIARRLSTIASFVAECRHHGLTWALVIDRPRVAPYQARGCPGWSDVETVIRELENASRWRELAAILLLVDVGLRRAECCSLDVEDFSAPIPAVRVRRKGGRVENRTISARCARAIEHSLAGRTTGPLLLSSTGRRLAPTTLADLTMRFRFGRPHACRRAGATELHRRGAHLTAISAYLGHANLATTQVYVSVLEDRPGHATRMLAGELTT